MSIAKLGPEERREALRRMADEEQDVLVIGGGVTGVGIALDGATRGLKTALVEQRDYAAGTSSQSSKLIHGGLRYLEKLDFGLVREALRERKLLLETLCPHLVHPVAFLYPLTGRVWERPYVGSGMALYDIMAGAGAVPKHKHYTKTKALEVVPAFKEDAFIGAIQYYDGQEDDARHTMMIGRTAARFGASVATSAQVTDLLRDGSKVVGATVKDLETGDEIEVRARQTIAALGVWSDWLFEKIGVEPFVMRPSKGVHITVPRERIPADSGVILRTEKSVLFFIPWDRQWILGTTDTDWEFDLARVAPTKSDVQYIIDQANRFLRQPLTIEDVTGTFAGLRPLVAPGEAASTADLSREHTVAEPLPGLVAIAGGKYTTYRVMAKDALDAAVRAMGGDAECITDKVPLVGAAGYEGYKASRVTLAERSGLSVESIDHLLGRQGSLIDEILDLVAERPELGEPLPGGDPYLKAEVVYACTNEGALHLEDVLMRRTRLWFQTADRGEEAAETTAQLMGEALGWDEDTVKHELELYRARIKATLEAESLDTDEEANEVFTRPEEERAGAI